MSLLITRTGAAWKGTNELKEAFNPPSTAFSFSWRQQIIGGSWSCRLMGAHWFRPC